MACRISLRCPRVPLRCVTTTRSDGSASSANRDSASSGGATKFSWLASRENSRPKTRTWGTAKRFRSIRCKSPRLYEVRQILFRKEPPEKFGRKFVVYCLLDKPCLSRAYVPTASIASPCLATLSYIVLNSRGRLIARYQNRGLAIVIARPGSCRG
jgi:hypothetical protein